MPEVYIYVAEGRSPAQKKQLMADITDVVVKDLGVRPASVVVQIMESPKHAKARGGMPYDEIGTAMKAGQSVDEAIAGWRRDRGLD